LVAEGLTAGKHQIARANLHLSRGGERVDHWCYVTGLPVQQIILYSSR
jgi:hypothetical protein